MARNKEEEFTYISEEDYKTLISVYQQKTFDLFNQNIALEAKATSLNSLIKSLNSKIEEITEQKEKLTKKTTNKRSKVSTVTDDGETDEETFN
jgi:predicted  nucleic acid-binding Zn-ribbon protein